MKAVPPAPSYTRPVEIPETQTSSCVAVFGEVSKRSLGGSVAEYRLTVGWWEEVLRLDVDRHGQSVLDETAILIGERRKCTRCE